MTEHVVAIGGELGDLLRGVFAPSVDDPLPEIFLDLLSQLDVSTNSGETRAAEAAPAPRMTLDDGEFKRQLTQLVPHLRAYGRSLSNDRDMADDLVQETMLKAWAVRDHYQAGTNMRAWTFVILRNLFLSQRRRARFRGEWNPEAAERLLSAPASQDRIVDLSDLQRALMALPPPQREALILVGAGGFSYEDAAEITSVAVGTIKSRVARGRTALEQMINGGQLPSRRKADNRGGRSAFDSIMAEVDELTAS